MDVSTDRPSEPAEPVGGTEPARPPEPAEPAPAAEPTDVAEAVDTAEPTGTPGTADLFAAAVPGAPPALPADLFGAADPTGTGAIAGTAVITEAAPGTAAPGTDLPLSAVGTVEPAVVAGDRPVVEGGLAQPVRAGRTQDRRSALAVVLLVAVLAVVALVVAVPRDADRRFVDAARAEGHPIAPGLQQELLVSGARKICQRMHSHRTDAQRRATALSPAEVGAFTATFVDDARGFTVLALDTYCAR